MRLRSGLASHLSLGLLLLETTPPEVLITGPTRHHDSLSYCLDNDAAYASAKNRADIVRIMKDCHPASGVEI